MKYFCIKFHYKMTIYRHICTVIDELSIFKTHQKHYRVLLLYANEAAKKCEMARETDFCHCRLNHSVFTRLSCLEPRLGAPSPGKRTSYFDLSAVNSNELSCLLVVKRQNRGRSSNFKINSCRLGGTSIEIEWIEERRSPIFRNIMHSRSLLSRKHTSP